MEAKTRCSTILVELPSGDKEVLVDIQIDCPVCGIVRMQLPGHHLRVIRNALVDAIDQYPTLTGTDAQIQQVDRFGWSGPPHKSEMN